MANVKSIIAANLSQRQRDINQRDTEQRLLGTDRLLASIIRVDGNIEVPDRPGFAWAQEYSPSDDTNPFHVFNDKKQTREGLTVWVGAGLGGRREVLDWNNGTIVNTPDYNAQKYLPVHHSDHEWPDFKPGPDAIQVYPRSLTMLRTYPGEAGALTVSASSLRYVAGNALITFPGKNSLDISGSQPASGLALFVGIYLDPSDNTLKTVDGATTSDSPAITPDSPTFPETAILSANVRLDGDQTTFSEVDIVDARQILDSSGSIDGTRVSKLVSPDGSIDPVFSADNSGDVTLAGTGDLIVPDLIIHSGDTDTNIAFADDDIEFTAGNLSMLKLTEAGQDVVDIGDVAGGGDVDIDFNDGQMFLRGSDGFLGIGNVIPTRIVDIRLPTGGIIALGRADTSITNGNTLGVFHFQGDDPSAGTIRSGGFVACLAAGTWDTDDYPGQLRFATTPAGGSTPSQRAAITSEGDMGIGILTSLGAQLHVDQSDNAAAQPVLLLDQADIDEPFEKYIGTSTAATLNRSLVDNADVTTATLAGWRKIEIDDTANLITDGDYFEPFYSLA